MYIEKPITAALVAATATAYFTSDALLKRAIIKNLSFHNSDSVARTVIVYLVPSAGTASITNQISPTRSLLPDETWECSEAVNKVLLGGGAIYAVASSASVIAVAGSVMEHSY
jgi:hypothetical protein